MAGPLNHVVIAMARDGNNSSTVDPASTGAVVTGAAFTPTSGRFLVCACYGAVTSGSTTGVPANAPTGWVKPVEAVNNGGLYIWYRATASGTSADQVVANHNGSNYPVLFEFWEFAAGTTWVNAVAATAQANAAAQTLSGLTGTNWTCGLVGGANSTTLTYVYTWDNGVEQADCNEIKVGTDGYSYSSTAVEDDARSTASFAATQTAAGGPPNHERIVFAVKPAAAGGSTVTLTPAVVTVTAPALSVPTPTLVAFDAKSRNGASDTILSTTNMSWTHTPVSTARGVLVGIIQDLVASDQVTAVTYGGVAMTRVVSTARSVTEIGRVYLYFLGSGIPTGPQTVAVTVSSTANKTAHCVTVTSNGTTTEVDAFNSADLGIIANPSVTVTHSASLIGWFGYAAHFYGGPAPVSTGLQTGETYGNGVDFGASAGHSYYRTAGAPAATSTYGYTTLASDDQLIAAVVVRQGGSATVAPTLVATRTPTVAESDTSLTKTTASFAVNAGDLLMVTGATGDAVVNLATPVASGGGVTWTRPQFQEESAYSAEYLWAGTVASAATITVSVTVSGSGNLHTFKVHQYRDHGGVGLSAKAFAASGAPQVPLSPTVKSAVIFHAADWNIVTGARTYLQGLSEVAYTTQPGLYTVYDALKADVTPGFNLYGLTAPTGQKWTAIAAEVKGSTGTPPSTVTLTPAVVTVTAPALVGTPGQVTVALTPATVTVTARTLVATPGQITVVLTSATVTVTARPLAVVAGSAVTLTPAVLTTTAVALAAAVVAPKIETLVDSFDSALDKAVKWISPSPAVIWDAGRVKIPLSTGYNSLGTHVAGTHSLTGSSVYAKITHPDVGNGSRETFMTVNGAGGSTDRLSLFVSGTTFRARRTNGGVHTNGTSQTYSPTTHAWWRISESAGTAFFDYSADGLSWTNLWSTAPGFDINLVSFTVVSGYWGTESAADTYVDNVNVAPVAGSAVTLTPAVVTVSARPLSAVPGPVAVTLTPATVTVTARPLVATPGQISRSLTPATLTVTARPLVATPGQITRSLTPATLTVTAQPLSAAAANQVTVALTPAVVTVTARPLSVTLGQVTRTLTPATVTITARPLVAVPGPVFITLTPATLKASAVAMSPSLLQVLVTLTPATLLVTAPPFEVIVLPVRDITVTATLLARRAGSVLGERAAQSALGERRYQSSLD